MRAHWGPAIVQLGKTLNRHHDAFHRCTTTTGGHAGSAPKAHSPEGVKQLTHRTRDAGGFCTHPRHHLAYEESTMLAHSLARLRHPPAVEPPASHGRAPTKLLLQR